MRGAEGCIHLYALHYDPGHNVAKHYGLDHIYQQDYPRNLAMKRVGSTQGAIASVAGTDQRKTATEGNTLMSAANGMSTDAVDRCCWTDGVSRWNFNQRENKMSFREIRSLTLKPSLRLRAHGPGPAEAVQHTNVAGLSYLGLLFRLQPAQSTCPHMCQHGAVRAGHR